MTYTRTFLYVYGDAHDGNDIGAGHLSGKRLLGYLLFVCIKLPRVRRYALVRYDLYDQNSILLRRFASVDQGPA